MSAPDVLYQVQKAVKGLFKKKDKSKKTGATPTTATLQRLRPCDGGGLIEMARERRAMQVAECSATPWTLKTLAMLSFELNPFR